jgi:hypothetical protein
MLSSRVCRTAWNLSADTYGYCRKAIGAQRGSGLITSPLPAELIAYGVIALIRVDQFEYGDRVPPHVGSVLNCANEQFELTSSPAM